MLQSSQWHVDGAMMKTFRIATRVIAVFLLTYLFTRLWLQCPESERFWTRLNNLLGNGENPGLASDIELITVLAVAFTGAIIVVHLSFKLWQAVIKHDRG